LTVTTSTPGGTTADAEYSIAMWGPPTSGKTTFIGALNIALALEGGAWKMVGRDDASTALLTKLTDSLANDRKFPEGTVGVDTCRWLLTGSQQQVVRGGLFRRKRTERVSQSVRLDLVDPAGGLYGTDVRTSDYARGVLLDNLQRSRGIIFIFDPIREFWEGDGFRFTVGVLNSLAQLMTESGQLGDGHLPHHIAICITKFDEVRVLQTAEKLELVTARRNDEFGFPRVEAAHAEELLRNLCQHSQSGNAGLMLDNLRQHFAPERIRYFATSAIGFHVDPASGAYDPDDYQNLMPDPGDPMEMCIRGSVRPINVIDPVMWLASCVPSDRGKGAGS
jgi:hypothetical protein